MLYSFYNCFMEAGQLRGHFFQWPINKDTDLGNFHHRIPSARPGIQETYNQPKIS